MEYFSVAQGLEPYPKFTKEAIENDSQITRCILCNHKHAGGPSGCWKYESKDYCRGGCTGGPVELIELGYHWFCKNQAMP